MWFCLSLKRLQSLTKRAENIAREEESWQDDVSLGDNEDSWGNEDFADNSQHNESRNRTKKPKGRPRADSQGAKIWFDEEVFALIEIGSNFEQLYHVKHSLYHLKDERAKNLGKVQQQLQEKGFEATTKQISEKMVVLKNYFSAEKRKSEASARKSGSGREDIYIPKWQFYRHLLFLKDNFTPKATESNVKRKSSEERPSNSKAKASKSNLEISQVASSIENIADAFSAKKCAATDDTKIVRSEDDIFGEMIAKMLSKIPSSEEKYMLQLRMQQDIIQTIFRCGNSMNTGPHRILSPVFHSHHSDRNLGNYNRSSALPSPQESQLAYPQHVLSETVSPPPTSLGIF